MLFISLEIKLLYFALREKSGGVSRQLSCVLFIQLGVNKGQCTIGKTLEKENVYISDL